MRFLLFTDDTYCNSTIVPVSITGCFVSTFGSILRSTLDPILGSILGSIPVLRWGAYWAPFRGARGRRPGGGTAISECNGLHATYLCNIYNALALRCGIRRLSRSLRMKKQNTYIYICEADRLTMVDSRSKPATCTCQRAPPPCPPPPSEATIGSSTSSHATLSALYCQRERYIRQQKKKPTHTAAA